MSRILILMTSLFRKSLHYVTRDIDDCWLKYETENIESEQTKSEFIKEKDQIKSLKHFSPIFSDFHIQR